MKHILIHKNGDVIDDITTNFDIAVDNLVIVNSIPEFIQREGYDGVLHYNETDGVRWSYVEAPVRDEPEYTITDAEIEAAYQEGVQEA